MNQQYSELVKIISSLILVLHTVFITVVLVLLLVRRNYQPLRARSVVLQASAAIAALLSITIFLLRTIIGPNDFPCFIHALPPFLSFPLYAFPLVFRAYRLFIISKLDKLKAIISRSRTMSLRSVVRSMRQKSDNSNDALYFEDVDDDSNDEYEDDEEPAADITATNVDDDDAIIPIVGSATLSPRAKAGEPMSKAERRARARSVRVAVRRLRFLISERFFLGTLLIIAAVSLLAWTVDMLIMAGTTEDYNPLLGCVRTNDVYYFAVTVVIIIIGSWCIFAILVRNIRDEFSLWTELIFSSIVWLLAIIGVACGIFIPTYFETIEFTYFPVVNFILIASFVDLSYCVLRPAIQTFYWSNTFSDKLWYSHEDHDEIVQVLADKEAFESFKAHCEREFSSENLLCWEMIERYKATTKSEKRVPIKYDIFYKFVRRGADLALNIPSELCRSIEIRVLGLEAACDDDDDVVNNNNNNMDNSSSDSVAVDVSPKSAAQQKAANSSSGLDPAPLNLFDELQTALCTCMSDSYLRWTSSPAYKKLMTSYKQRRSTLTSLNML